MKSRPSSKKQYKNLDPKIQEMVDHLIQELRSAKNPAYLGKYKQNKRIFAYDIGRKYGIIYNVNWSENTIEFLRVCDHKSVYGKD